MYKKDTLEEVLNNSFLDYAAFIAQRRALPDARDGMKYTARQILHAQKRAKLTYNKPRKKAAQSTAAATAFSYIHGTSSAYEQIIRMGRDLVQRYKFEDIQGNGGTPCSANDYSQERYVEVRLSKLAEVLFEYDKEGLKSTDWVEAYSGDGYFPMVLPAIGFNNIVNGSFGSIGVGMVSSIPQFNLKEINDAIIQLIDNPQYELNVLPDFSSYGILMNPKTTLESLSKGEGKSCILRGEIIKNKDEGWLEVVSLPYGSFTETLMKQLGKEYESGTTLYSDFKDLSKDRVRVRLYSKNLDALEEWLYQNTIVQNHFTIKMTMLDNGKVPKIFSLKEALLAHINHVKKVYRKQYEYQLIQLRKRMNIIEGLLKAYSILDDVIELIKQSSGRANAITQLISKFDFNQEQAEAIVDLRLHRLSSLDIQNLQQEKESNQAEQDRINEVLNKEQLFNDELKEIYHKVADEFGDERRTKIYSGDDYEAGVDGSAPTKQFYLSVENEMMTASYVADDKTMLPINLDDDIYFITTGGRTIHRKGSEISLGTYPIKDKLNILKGEHLLMAHQKNPNSKYSYIEFIDKITGKSYSIHKSFIESGTPRGKKFTSKKVDLEYKDYSIRSKLPSLR